MSHIVTESGRPLTVLYLSHHHYAKVSSVVSFIYGSRAKVNSRAGESQVTINFFVFRITRLNLEFRSK